MYRKLPPQKKKCALEKERYTLAGNGSSLFLAYSAITKQIAVIFLHHSFLVFFGKEFVGMKSIFTFMYVWKKWWWEATLCC